MVSFTDLVKTLIKTRKTISDKVRKKFTVKKTLISEGANKEIEEILEAKKDVEKAKSIEDSLEVPPPEDKPKKKGLSLIKKGLFAKKKSKEVKPVTDTPDVIGSTETEKPLERKESTVEEKINGRPSEIDKQNIPENKPAEEEEIIKIRNEWWIKLKTILIFFMKFEYKLISFFIPEKNIMLKSDVCSLFFVRMMIQLSVGAILAPEGALEGASEDQSSTVL